MRSRWILGIRLVLGIGFMLPLIPVFIWIFANRWSFPARFPQVGGVNALRNLPSDGALSATVRSLLVASAVAAIAVVLGALAAALIVQSSKRSVRFIEAVLLAPAVIPPFVLVMGVSPLAIRLGVPSPIAVVLVLTVLALPYSTFVIRSALARYDWRWEEEARLLGVTKYTALRRIRLRILARPLITATLLAFLIGWTDYIVTLVVGGGELITLPMLIASATSAPGNDASLAAMAAISILIPLVGFYLAQKSGQASSKLAVAT